MRGSIAGRLGAALLCGTMAMLAPGLTQGAGTAQTVDQASATTAMPVPRPGPTRGPVTGLPLPRYVSLKTSEGNARRGPGLTHRIDWVFTRPGMPLRVTAEHENWRRVEDAEGAGGWVHYSLLSGVRSVLVTEDLTELLAKPDLRASVVARAEMRVVARLLECDGAWCRIARDGTRGWVRKSALWGVDEGGAAH